MKTHPEIMREYSAILKEDDEPRSKAFANAVNYNDAQSIIRNLKDIQQYALDCQNAIASGKATFDKSYKNQNSENVALIITKMSHICNHMCITLGIDIS